MNRIKNLSQILLFNSCYVKYNNFASLVIIVMFQNSEDCNIKNDITSSCDQLLADEQSNLLGISVNAIRRTSPSVEITQQIDTNAYVKVAKERYFLICDSCLWCASYFDHEMTETKCPVCRKGKIDCMPICEDKNYRFDCRILEVLN
jgi:hypothetical protein